MVYVGHIPHGFYEEEMRGYFSQFGTVTRLRLARSKKVRDICLLLQWLACPLPQGAWLQWGSYRILDSR